jgi:hypothetical protein
MVDGLEWKRFGLDLASEFKPNPGLGVELEGSSEQGEGAPASVPNQAPRRSLVILEAGPYLW